MAMNRAKSGAPGWTDWDITAPITPTSVQRGAPSAQKWNSSYCNSQLTRLT